MHMASYLKGFISRRKMLANPLQLRFLHLLHRLLTNGYPLLDAIETVKWNKELEKPATRILTCLKDGMSIDEAFDQAKFHPLITSYLYFVKGNGDLEGSIKKCAAMYEYRIKNTNKFQQAARYPLILLFIFSLLLYFIKQSVLPSFQDIFQASMSASSTVQVSIILIEMLTTITFVLIFVLGILLFVWLLTKGKLPIEKQLNVYRTIPLYRSFLKLQTSFYFATHFSSLLKTGMSFKEILDHMTRQKKLPIISYYAQQMTSELSRGVHIASLLTVFTFLEGQLTTIFSKNADAQALEKDLSIYAELLMEEIQRKIVKIITFVQPVFFTILAGFIIFIYITLMWPMFQLIKTI